MADKVTITSIAGGAPKPVFDGLGPLFEKRMGVALRALYDTMSGIAARVAAHEALDVLVMPVALIDAYVKDGTVLPAGRAALANIGLAVGVKAGAKIPDISTPDALRKALLAARAVVHAPPSATPSGAHSDKVIKEFGIADTIAGRVIHRAGLAGGVAMIASGEAALGIFPKKRIGECGRRHAGRFAAGRSAIEHRLWRRSGCRQPRRRAGGVLHPVPDRAGKSYSLDRVRI